MTITWKCDDDGKVYNEAVLHKNSSEEVLAYSGRMYEFCNHYVLPYKGAEYHVIVNVLPEPHVLEKPFTSARNVPEPLKSIFAAKSCRGWAHR